MASSVLWIKPPSQNVSRGSRTPTAGSLWERETPGSRDKRDSSFDVREAVVRRPAPVIVTCTQMLDERRRGFIELACITRREARPIHAPTLLAVDEADGD